MKKKSTEITQDQIQAWKEEYGKIYELPVGDKTAYIRGPKMTDLKRGLRALSEDSEVAFAEEMLRSLWLGGDSEIKNDDDYFTPAGKKLKRLLEFDDAEITKLSNNQYQIQIEGFNCTIRHITRHDLKTAERSNPSSKPFVTQEKLFELVCIEKDPAFNNKNDAAIRFPLFQALESIQNTKYAALKNI